MIFISFNLLCSFLNLIASHKIILIFVFNSLSIIVSSSFTLNEVFLMIKFIVFWIVFIHQLFFTVLFSDITFVVITFS